MFGDDSVTITMDVDRETWDDVVTNVEHSRLQHGNDARRHQGSVDGVNVEIDGGDTETSHGSPDMDAWLAYLVYGSANNLL